MKQLSNTDTEILVKMWKTVTASDKRTPMDYASKLYLLFARFAAVKGMRIIQPEICQTERKMLDADLALMYVGALRHIIDPKREQTEADVVMLMIMATHDQRKAAIRYMRRQGVSI